ncbi:hypothetical protein [Hydrogenophaga sp. RWCD_12]|uniref:hypothetical protein n=1 Tax=Hydrogenophaga sp. RWCD_12 TaxID=3391190 RepID=UPI00398469D7
MTTAIAITAICLAGCWEMSILTPPSAVPESVPVPIVEGGALAPILLVLPECKFMIPEIGFPRSELVSPDLVRLLGADVSAGKAGVPLRLIVDFYREVGDGQFVLWRKTDRTTENIGSWGNDKVARVFQGATLPRGRYRVQATLVAGNSEMAKLNPRFYLWSTFEKWPTSENCKAPAYGETGT